MPGSHDRALEALMRRGRLRSLAERRGADFASNDYLGLASSKELADAVLAAVERGVPVGSGGSRLLRGNHPEHEALEAEAAAHFGGASALFFGSGFAANSAIFATLPERGDCIFYDELVHASAHEGMRLSKAEARSFAHNDAQSAADAIRVWRAGGGVGTAWIAVESLYSMDGDRAPLDSLMALADGCGGMLVIDEAHATGVFGPNGRGLAAHLEGRDNVISLHTCGKALGVMGALVLAPAVLRDFLVNRARGFIYATAPSPIIAATVRAALALSRTSERRGLLHERIAFAGAALARAGHAFSGTQVQPILAGSDVRAVGLAQALQARGFDVRAIRPPTVPEGTARLRLTLTLNTTEQETSALIDALVDAEAELAA